MPKLGMQPIRRRQLIDATLDAINEVGMHDATIAQIARRAGVSTGIISHYFKDKNGLLEATMRDITSQLRDAVLNRLHALPDGSASQRLQAIVGGNFDETQISSDEGLAGLLGQQHAPADALSVTAGQQPSPAVESGVRIPPRAAARAGAGGRLRAGGADRRPVAAGGAQRQTAG